MDPLTFLLHRVKLFDLPPQEVRNAELRIRGHELSWLAAFGGLAKEYVRSARREERGGKGTGPAHGLWQWAAAAYHAASLGTHLDPVRRGTAHVCLRLRRAAIACHLRAMRGQGEGERSVRIAFRGRALWGYLRIPQKPTMPLVVLLNGLDSLCEVELRAFGKALLERGAAVLSLDLPADYRSRRRRPF